MKLTNKAILASTVALLMSGAANAGTVTWTGTVSASCSIDSDVAGTVVQVGATQELSSDPVDGGTDAQVTVTVNDGSSLIHIGSPVVDVGGTPVAMDNGDETTIRITNAALGYTQEPMVPAGLSISAAGTYTFDVTYSDTASAALGAGAYTVVATSTCL